MTYIDPTLNMNRTQVEEMITKVRKENLIKQQMRKDIKQIKKLFNRR